MEETTPYDSHKVIRPIVLWADGAVAYYMTSFGGAYADEGGTTYPFEATYEGAHAAFIDHLNDLDRGKSSLANWGAFRMQGDSLSMQVMMTVIPGMNKWTTLELGGFIRNDTTLTLTETRLPRDDSRTQISRTYHFRPLENKPTSENWTQTHPKLQ